MPRRPGGLTIDLAALQSNSVVTDSGVAVVSRVSNNIGAASGERGIDATRRSSSTATSRTGSPVTVEGLRLERSTDLYFDRDQIAVRWISRIDSNLTDPTAIVTLHQAVT